jgi:copper chaperone CopZ
MTCAYAVRVAMQRYKGVDSVEVSLSKGTASIQLHPGNGIRPAELWETIRKNGYTNKTTRVIVRGEVSAGGDQFKVSGSGEIFALQDGPKTPGQTKRFTGKTVTIHGIITPDKDLKRAVPLVAESIEQ